MLKNKPLKLILDTNLWISFLISNRQDRIDNLLFIEKVRILFSPELLEEIKITIQKPKLKKFFGENALVEMLLNFEPYIDLIDIKTTVSICRDEKDNFLLALAKDGRANYLLTGDKDLLEIKVFKKRK